MYLPDLPPTPPGTPFPQHLQFHLSGVPGKVRVKGGTGGKEGFKEVVEVREDELKREVKEVQRSGRTIVSTSKSMIPCTNQIL